MTGYTKLFGSIVASTIWDEDDKTRIVWITMLAMANRHGEVESSIPGLAKFSKVSIEAVEQALEKFKRPDPYSRTKDHDGRRIEDMDGGWFLLNHPKYREKASADEVREQTRKRVERFRTRNALCNGDSVTVTQSNGCNAKQRQKAEAKSDQKQTQIHGSSSADIKSVFEAWNALGTVPKCLLISDARRRKLEIRLREPFFSANWQAALAKIKVSSFCQGAGSTGWKASFDWFLQPDSAAKTMEGKYDERPSNLNGKAPQRTAPENPRNAGTCKPVIPYAEAIAAKLTRQREAASGMADQMVQNAAAPSPVAGNGG